MRWWQVALCVMAGSVLGVCLTIGVWAVAVIVLTIT